ncbi:tripartite tricarboxylate transporter TctB family protein [Martelella mediterranea]|uniref:tripartite tricarboxylate transporter TctB family protein n=1 Tax=Martelella mediterranea TaxID=293089 RepID=UPI001E63A010|nr:tripartite tricarboxylate transporter TctB family protein [Martelella mediterranea]MCD1636453.1 tripartite tricarboxylate transporter TctB family protein [Martelella mediterranea]
MNSSRSIWAMAIVVIGLSAMAIQQAGVAPDISVDQFGSGTAPLAVAVSLIILSVFMVVEAWLKRANEFEDLPIVNPEALKARRAKPYMQHGIFKGTGTIGLFLIFVVLLEATRAPFWLLTAVFLFLASRVIEGSLRQWLILSLLLSLGLGVALDVIFARFLLIELP